MIFEGDGVLGLVVVGLIGLVVGSFLTVLVDRLLFNQNWISDRSRCPNCQKKIAPYDLIPIISWLILKARCRKCQEPISWQYPVIELSTFIVFVSIYAFWPKPLENTGDWLELSFFLVAIGGLISLAIADFRYFLLPDKIARKVGVFVAAGVGVMAGFQPNLFPPALISCLFFAGVMLFVHHVSNGKMALGDVKLSFTLGLLIADWKLIFVVIGLASILGLILAVGVGLTKKQSLQLKTALPFGPPLIAATVVVFVAQGSINSFLGF